MTQFTRRPDDWRPRLDAFLDTVQRAPFCFGIHDCGLFVGSAVEAMTGHDPAIELRGRYTTQAGITRILRRMGHPDHVEFVASLFAEIHPSECQIGDLAAIPVEGDVMALGLVAGSRVLVPMPGTIGLGSVDLLQAVRAFEVKF